MLLDLWGLIGRRYPPGVGSSLRAGFRPGIVVVEVEGKQYRIPEGELQSFLKNTVKKVEKQVQKQVVKRSKKVVEAPKQIVLIKSPSAVRPQVVFHVEQANEQLDLIWRKISANLQQMQEDDDILTLLLGAY